MSTSAPEFDHGISPAAGAHSLHSVVRPLSGYSVILADPPWKYYGDPNKDQACGKHYNCMTPEEIAALPVKMLCADRAVVLVWATCPMLDVAMDTIRAWGLHYRGVAYVWVKTRADGGIINGQGVRPTLTKPTTELVLAASTVKRGRPLKILNEGQGQVVLAPRGEHSKKPDEVQKRIETLLGDVPRLELFARRKRPGWDAWGNEV
jgi:site-specific DNA-methyltransferase (adenine-specific)